MSSIFPDNSTIAVSSLIIDRSVSSYGSSPVFDFEKGEFKKIDGKVYIGSGVEVLKNWVEKTLRTERFRFPIYSFNYGITLEELLIKDIPYQVLVSELKDQITQALMQDIRIDNVSNFKFSRKGSTLNVEFKVTAFDNNTLNMEVSI